MDDISVLIAVVSPAETKTVGGTATSRWFFHFFLFLSLSGSGIRIILKDGLSVRQLYGSPLLSVLLLSISCPIVCRILMSQFLFCFSLSCPNLHPYVSSSSRIPNFPSFFSSFFLHPKHILFSPICAQTTHISTRYTLPLLSSLHSRHPHSLVTTLSSPLIQPSRSGHQWYHTLPRFLKSLYLYLSKRYALSTRSRFRIQKVFLLLCSLPALAIPPTTDVPLDEQKSVNRICDTNFISSRVCIITTTAIGLLKWTTIKSWRKKICLRLSVRFEELFEVYPLSAVADINLNMAISHTPRSSHFRLVLDSLGLG